MVHENITVCHLTMYMGQKGQKMCHVICECSRRYVTIIIFLCSKYFYLFLETIFMFLLSHTLQLFNEIRREDTTHSMDDDNDNAFISNSWVTILSANKWCDDIISGDTALEQWWWLCDVMMIVQVMKLEHFLWLCGYTVAVVRTVW